MIDLIVNAAALVIDIAESVWLLVLVITKTALLGLAGVVATSIIVWLIQQALRFMAWLSGDGW